MPKYNLVLLDADDTLFDFSIAESGALRFAAQQNHLPFTEELLYDYRTVNQALWRRLERGEVRHGELQRRRFAELFAKRGIHLNPERFNLDYLEGLSRGSTLIDGALELCRALASVCRLCIVTNGLQRVQRRRLENSPLLPYISALFISEEIGWQKPRPEFFNEVFRRLGDPDRNRAILLGDSLSSDMAGGAAAGVATCWYSPQGELPPGVRVDYRIHRLCEFYPIVMGRSTD
jgi:2-haloacid dehalogenase